MSSRDDVPLGASPSTFDSQNPLGSAPPTFASFSPVTLSATTPSRNSRRSTVLVHQKSPLLLATPPQITRALAYSHPFLLPLNTFVGLLTWSTGDSWQSFLLLSAFWAATLYGDILLLRAGPVIIGIVLIVGMYGRRFSPLSSSIWSEAAGKAKAAVSSSSSSKTVANGAPAQGNGGEKSSAHARTRSEVASAKHQKTLDEIVDTLKEFTGRCNMLMEPFLEMTDFLSTQRTPTSATTKPALTAMFVRLLIVTPFWIILTMSPWRIITTRRVILVSGTLILTWHSRVCRVTRTILWRSASVRRLLAAITGLRFEEPLLPGKGDALKRNESQHSKASSLSVSNLSVAHKRSGSHLTKGSGVKFTFIIFENQRRWVGLGWTSSLFAYERPAWTDEHNNAVPQKEEFELPHVEDGSQMQWTWAEGSRWRVDGVADDHGFVDYDGAEGKNGWIYYDNKWQGGKRGSDGWGRWTRRRKWYRDAELVEAEEQRPPQELEASEHPHTQSYSTANERMRIEPMIVRPEAKATEDAENANARTGGGDDAGSLHSTSSRFWPTLRRRQTDKSSSAGSSVRQDSQNRERRRTRRPSELTNDDDDDTSRLDFAVELELQKQGKDGGQWGIGDEARMNLE